MKTYFLDCSDSEREKIFRENLDDISNCIENLIRYNYLTKKDWKKISLVCCSDPFFVDFAQKFIDFLDIIILSKGNLPIEFIEKNIKKFDWYYLSSNPVLTEEFIQKHSEKINWQSKFLNK